MKLTLSVIKADVGSIGGHVCPSKALLDTVKNHIADNGKVALQTGSKVLSSHEDAYAKDCKL